MAFLWLIFEILVVVFIVAIAPMGADIEKKVFLSRGEHSSQHSSLFFFSTDSLSNHLTES